VLELVVLAQESVAEGALEDAAAVLPDTAFALQADSILQRTRAGVVLEALASVADPGLAEVADGSDHAQSSGVDSGMLHHTVSRLQHALDLSTLSANRQSLQTLAEVAKCSRLLFLLALVAFHGRIARQIRQGHFPAANLFEAQLLLFSLLALARFLFRHFGKKIKTRKT